MCICVRSKDKFLYLYYINKLQFSCQILCQILSNWTLTMTRACSVLCRVEDPTTPLPLGPLFTEHCGWALGGRMRNVILCGMHYSHCRITHNGPGANYCIGDRYIEKNKLPKQKEIKKKLRLHCCLIWSTGVHVSMLEVEARNLANGFEFVEWKSFFF